MKRTKWYPPEITPVHIGVYEVINNDKLYASYWSGEQWGICVAVLNKQRVNKDVYLLAKEFNFFDDIDSDELFIWRGVQK